MFYVVLAHEHTHIASTVEQTRIQIRGNFKYNNEHLTMPHPQLAVIPHRPIAMPGQRVPFCLRARKDASHNHTLQYLQNKMGSKYKR